MRIGDITSSPDTVGVAVIQWPIPQCPTPESILDNCRAIAQRVAETKAAYPGTDLIVFPEASTQGVKLDKKSMRKYAMTVDGPEVAIFKQACIDNKVWGVFSLDGEENPGKNPYNAALLINDKGEIVQHYRKVMPWVPAEAFTPGDELFVTEGPKGIKIGLMICDDGNYPEIWRDLAYKGAELVVRTRGYMYPAAEQQVRMDLAMAWANNVYVADAGAAGYIDGYYMFGHSLLAGYDGRLMGQCGTAPYESQYGEFSISSIRDMRKTWQAENHLYKLVHRGYSGMIENGESEFGDGSLPFQIYRDWAADPEKVRTQIDSLTRVYPGVESCPIEGIPYK